MFKRRVRRISGIVLALAGIGVAGLVTAIPAQAATFMTYGSGLNVRADASVSSGIVRTLAGPTSIDVDCQKAGDVVNASGGSSNWWGHVPALGGYVSVAYVDIPESKLPGVPECAGGDPEPPAEDITLADVQAMFGSRIVNPALVSQGLPSLNQAMRDAQVNTPRRQAAFLATLVHESRLEYNIREIGDTRPYGGRGYIQLTGDFNYRPAGQYFGIDLIGNPELARSLQWSAPIARWYWTVARNINPFADALNMGKVNAAIGYPAGAEDGRRCESFKKALQYLSGSVPAGVICVRSKAYAGDTSRLDRAQFDSLGKSSDGLG